MSHDSVRYTDDGPLIYTIGHSQQPIEQLIDQLQRRSIALAVDVRSTPWLRFGKQFNKEPLEDALSGAGIDYLWLGAHLGQKPEGDQFYDSAGYALYDRISDQPWFLKALGQVEYEAERRDPALLCVEEAPEECHRYHLLGRVLVERGSHVVHLRRDGRAEPQGQVAHRLGEGQESLLSDSASPVWRSPKPMRPSQTDA
jgi:uncharacterized protein (DUF488 family)